MTLKSDLVEEVQKVVQQTKSEPTSVSGFVAAAVKKELERKEVTAHE